MMVKFVCGVPTAALLIMRECYMCALGTHGTLSVNTFRATQPGLPAKC